MYLEQDYAWVGRGMIFPFMDYVDRCGCCLTRAGIALLSYKSWNCNLLIALSLCNILHDIGSRRSPN